MNIRTDLALEASALHGDPEGIVTTRYEKSKLSVIHTEIQSEEAALKLGKPQGTYVTIELPKLWSYDYALFSECVDVVADELRALLQLNEDAPVLVAGLGNEKITPDALGPASLRHLMITRHLKEHMPQWFAKAGLRQVGAISPDVLGNTGIEALHILKGVCQQSQPASLIVIDALAARSLSRLTSTIQLSNAGIVPGSGVGNAREEISQSSMGIPVVSVGIPTVVDAATLAADVLDATFRMLKEKSGQDDPSFLASEDCEKQALFQEVLAPQEQNPFVTPKEIDRIIQELGKLLGFAINKALHKDVTIDDMAKFN